MEIRLLQSQIDEQLPNNILNKWRYNNSAAFRNDLTAKILYVANNFGLDFKTNNLLELNMKNKNLYVIIKKIQIDVALIGQLQEKEKNQQISFTQYLEN